MVESKDLKPCPICGGMAAFVTDQFERTLSVFCGGCKLNISGRYKNKGDHGFKKTRKFITISNENGWEELREELAYIWNTRGRTVSDKSPVKEVLEKRYGDSDD